MFTWSQLPGLSEAGNYTELATGETPIRTTSLTQTLTDLVPGVDAGHITARSRLRETKPVNIHVREAIQIRSFTIRKFSVVPRLQQTQKLAPGDDTSPEIAQSTIRSRPIDSAALLETVK